MKTITLAMVAVLAAVTMLSAGLAVPMQQASAGGDGGGNNFEFDNEQECERAFCSQTIDVTNDQSIED
jgi:hypothetical protein